MKDLTFRPPSSGRTALAFVVVALLALAVVPVLADRLVGRTQSELREVAEPARALVTEVQLSLALRGAALRDYLSTRDAAFIARYRQAAAREQAAYAKLEPLVGRMGGAVVHSYSELRGLERQWTERVEDLIGTAPAEADAVRARLAGEQIYEAALVTAAELDQAIMEFAAEKRARILIAERRTLVLTMVLVAIALAAAVLVGRLGARLRHHASEAELRGRELQDVLESKAKMVRGLTHDLKNPLNAIDGYAQLLEAGLKGELTADQRESVARIRAAAKSMMELVETLLELARAEAGQLKIVRAPTDLVQLIPDVVEQNRAMLEAAGLAVEVVVPPAGPTILTDAARVRQVLNNLLTNAAKYASGDEAGSGQVSVELEVPQQSGKGWAFVRVRDTGPGIPAAMQEAIFEEFTRLPNGRASGAGLGLAISRRIARLLGGDLTVKSVLGAGSTFTLRLPAQIT